MSIIIDAGHGGSDPGAVKNGAREKDMTLEISLYMYKRFQELKYPVMLTRNTDKTLEPAARTKIVRNSGAKYCISNHINAGGGDGSEVIHSIHNNGVLSNNILDEMVRAGQNKRRAFSRKGKSGQDYYFMHRDTGSTTTLIVEYGFIDSKDYSDIDTAAERATLAEAVIRAFCKYVKHPYKAPGTAVAADPKPVLKPKPTGKLYKVQLGAFSKEDGAKKMQKQAEEKGVKTVITRYDGFYRVQAGAFTVKANADKLADQLRAKGLQIFIDVD